MRALTNNTIILRLAVCCTALLVLFSTYVFVVPKTILGEMFFGRFPLLYHTGLATFFYEQSLRFDVKGGLPPPYAHYQLSRIYFVSGDLPRALEEINTELALYPDHVHANYILGLTLGYMHRDQEAIAAFAKFIEYKPTSWAPRNDKAWLHFKNGEFDQALDTLTPIIVLYPDNPWILNTYGVVLMNKGKYAEAKTALTHGLSVVNNMSSAEWGAAYPGNSPRIWEGGLDAMRRSFEENLALADQKLRPVDSL